MASFTPISSTFADGNTSVMAEFSYGDVKETQTYVFEGELSSKEIMAKLTELTKEYQAKWEEAQKATMAVDNNEAKLPLKTVEI